MNNRRDFNEQTTDRAFRVGTTGMVGGLLLFVAACSAPPPPTPRIEYYPVAFRQDAPEPVYSRMMWSHLPQPTPPKSETAAPLIHPVLSFEMPNATLREALEALSQSLGYRAEYSKEIQRRRVSLKLVGTVDEILGAIEKQAHVKTELDHDERKIHVVDEQTAPRL